MRLEVDPVRVRALRTRIGMPLDAAAKRAGLDVAHIERLESAPQSADLDTLRRLAKAYNRNWYVFLLDDEPGKPALPRDFRTFRTRRAVGSQTLMAFDDAEFLVEKILDLPRPNGVPALALPRITGLDPEAAARRVRDALGADLDAQRGHTGEYDTIRYWSSLLAEAGCYAVQLSFPYREVRAFCLRRGGISLIVVSSQDSPRARVFSLLHELGHVLLGGEAMCSPQPPELGVTGDEETFCNAFAAAMLMPADAFSVDPLALALRGKRVQLGDAVSLARRYGTSELATLRRLATVGFIGQDDYDRLHSERDAEFEEEFADEPRPSDGLRIRKQATRMINENSRLYATEVLDAHARGDISFREIGVLLGGNLKHVRAVREDLSR